MIIILIFLGSFVEKQGRLGTNRDMKRLSVLLLSWWLTTARKSIGHYSVYQQGWLEQEFSDYQFYKCFRLSKEAVVFIQNRLEPFYRDSTPLRRGVLLTLWILGQDVSYRCTEETVGFCYSAICRVFNHVVGLIVAHLGDCIDYNKTEQFYEDQCIRFASRFGVSNVCCVMDGTMIKTKKPEHEGEAYYSGYKKGYGVSVLVVSSIDREILYVSEGYPASTHDSAVLRASSLWQDASAGTIPLNIDRTILGDSAFPDVEWITLSTDQIGYASPRTISEHVFARLKGKFRILDGTIRQYIGTVPQIVVSCCVLSNIDLRFPSDN